MTFHCFFLNRSHRCHRWGTAKSQRFPTKWSIDSCQSQRWKRTTIITTTIATATAMAIPQSLPTLIQHYRRWVPSSSNTTSIRRRIYRFVPRATMPWRPRFNTHPPCSAGLTPISARHRTFPAPRTRTLRSPSARKP